MNKKYIVSLFFICMIVISSYVYSIHVVKKEDNVTQLNINEDTNQIQYELSSYVTDEMRMTAKNNTAVLCLREAFTPEVLARDSDAIAVVKIISEDYMDPKASFLGMTFGKLLVNNVISGNLKSGDVITYLKPGGYIDMATWEESQPEAATEKRRYLREKAGINTDLSKEYINVIAESDIEMEVGKTYLTYLYYDEKKSAYEIIGFGNGLREINVPQATRCVYTTNLKFNELKLKNNTTGEWEELDIYIKQNINNYIEK